MLEKFTYVYRKKKDLFSQNTLGFGIYSKHHFPLIIVPSLVSCLITVTLRSSFIYYKVTKWFFSPILCSLFIAVVHLFIPVIGRCTFYGNRLADLLITCAGGSEYRQNK